MAACVLLSLALASASAAPPGDPPDGGLACPLICFEPLDGGALSRRLSAPVPGCVLSPRDAGLWNMS